MTPVDKQRLAWNASVKQWWGERCAAKQLFFAPELVEEGQDYYGMLPWPAYATLRALYRDYCVWAPAGENVPSKASFAHYFKACSGTAPGDPETIRTRIGGELHYQMITTLYDMAPARERFLIGH